MDALRSEMHSEHVPSMKPVDGSLKDPVCGMTVEPDSPLRADHAGTTYRFCSAHCLSEFRRDPEKYTASAT